MKRITLPLLFLTAMTLILAVTAQAQQTDNEKVLARVNGEVITERELDQLIAQQMQGQAEIPPAQRQQFLDEIINLMLLAQAGEEASLDADPALQAQINNHRRTALAQAFVRNLTVAEPVAEEALRERYEAEYTAEPPIEYRARHILVSEREQAIGIIERLQQGEEFETLAQRFSQDGSAERGGDLGWFARGDMVAPFSEAVVAMDIGETSEAPVETRFGWHVIRLDDTRETEAPAFEQVAGELRMRLINERIQEELESLRDEADINYRVDWARP